jgi:hypothetical protein
MSELTVMALTTEALILHVCCCTLLLLLQEAAWI